MGVANLKPRKPNRGLKLFDTQVESKEHIKERGKDGDRFIGTFPNRNPVRSCLQHTQRTRTFTPHIHTHTSSSRLYHKDALACVVTVDYGRAYKQHFFTVSLVVDFFIKAKESTHIKWKRTVHTRERESVCVWGHSRRRVIGAGLELQQHC